jgi:hypothetical protein
MVLAQAEKYNQIDNHGHLYGAIIPSVRDYIREKKKGKYGEYHLAFCAHYVGDLSQPLQSIEHNLFNRKYHKEINGVANDEILDNLDKIKVYPISIGSEREIARIANQAMALGYKLEDEGRVLTKEEAYRQLSRSASLFRAIVEYATRTGK